MHSFVSHKTKTIVVVGGAVRSAAAAVRGPKAKDGRVVVIASTAYDTSNVFWELY